MGGQVVVVVDHAYHTELQTAAAALPIIRYNFNYN